MKERINEIWHGLPEPIRDYAHTMLVGAGIGALTAGTAKIFQKLNVPHPAEPVKPVSHARRSASAGTSRGRTSTRVTSRRTATGRRASSTAAITIRAARAIGMGGDEAVHCPHCSVTIGHPRLDHPIRVDILHRALVGGAALAKAAAIRRHPGDVPGVRKDQRNAGLTAMRPRAITPGCLW